MISQIMINWGEMGIEYNFGELLPGSITGRVHADDGPDCDFDDPHHMLAGVQIDLLDGDGNVIATTYTNADGEYSVHRLAAGHVQRARASAGRILRRRRARRLGRRRQARRSRASASSPASTSAPASTRIQYDFCEKPPAPSCRATCSSTARRSSPNDPLTPRADRRAARRRAHARRHAAGRRGARAAPRPIGRPDLCRPGAARPLRGRAGRLRFAS